MAVFTPPKNLPSVDKINRDFMTANPQYSPSIVDGSVNASKPFGSGPGSYTPTVMTGANIRENVIPQLNADTASIIKTTTPVAQQPATDTKKGVETKEPNYYEELYQNTFGTKNDQNPNSSLSFGSGARSYSPTDANGNPLSTEGVPTDPEMRTLYDMGRKADAMTQSSLKMIDDKYKVLQDEIKQANLSSQGQAGQFLAQTGGMRSLSGNVVLGKIEQDGLRRIQSLQSQEDSARLEVIKAQQERDYQLLEKKLGLLKDVRDKKFTLATKMADVMENRAKEVREENKKKEEELDKNKFETLKSAPAEMRDAIINSKSLSELATVAGDYLQGGTGIIGEYNFYKRDMMARGKTPVSFNEYQTQDANRKIRIAAASQDPNRILSANEAQALGLPFGTIAKEAYGKVPTKPPTEAQTKDAGYAQRTLESSKTIDSLQNTIVDYNPTAFLGAVAAEKTTIGNAFVADEIRQVRQAERDFVTAILRRESGAAISPSEFSTAEKQYFPRPGDDEKTLANKKRNRNNIIKNLSVSAGPALPLMLAEPNTGEQLGSKDDPMGLFK